MVAALLRGTWTNHNDIVAMDLADDQESITRQDAAMIGHVLGESALNM